MALTSDDLKAIETLLEPIKRDIRSLQLTLENETNRNIKLIADRTNCIAVNNLPQIRV